MPSSVHPTSCVPRRLPGATPVALNAPAMLALSSRTRYSETHPRYLDLDLCRGKKERKNPLTPLPTHPATPAFCYIIFLLPAAGVMDGFIGLIKSHMQAAGERGRGNCE